MKKLFYLLMFVLLVLIGSNHVYAEEACNKSAVEQLAKILYHEVGSDSAVDSSENFFMRLNTASIVLNNASGKSGNNWYEKIYNLTDSNYAGYSSYKDEAYASSDSRKAQMLYISAIVLSGKYNLPKNMTLQAAEDIVKRYGTVWYHVATTGNNYDVYFGYEGSSLNVVDVFGKSIYDTSVSHYKSLAYSLEQHNYSSYTSDNVCRSVANKDLMESLQEENGRNVSESSGIGAACTNPDVLRIIQFVLIIISIITIVVPIGLIVFGIIDFSKAVISGDEKEGKKNLNLFIKRVIYAVLVFAVPWIVKTVMIFLGDLTEDVNFTDCIANANSETIKELGG